jgi:hypothetical protein
MKAKRIGLGTTTVRMFVSFDFRKKGYDLLCLTFFSTFLTELIFLLVKGNEQHKL